MHKDKRILVYSIAVVVESKSWYDYHLLPGRD
jgi:hypothetical protein